MHLSALNLDEVAALLVSGGKGLLCALAVTTSLLHAHSLCRAADESPSTCGKRLASIGVANLVENRRKLRSILFSTPSLNHGISGVVSLAHSHASVPG